MSWRRFCKTSWIGLSKTSWRCLEGVLKMSWKRLENVLKTSWRRLGKMSGRSLEDVRKTPSVFLENVWPRRIYWSWSRRLEDVFWRRMSKVNILVLIKTSSRRRKAFSGRLQDVFIKMNVCWEARWNLLLLIGPVCFIQFGVGDINDVQRFF